MKPAWDDLAEAMDLYPGVYIADVDCGNEPDLCNQHEVTGYPTIKYFIRGEEHDYEGGRSLDELQNFANEELVLHCNIRDLDGTCTVGAKAYASKWMSSDKHSGTRKEIKRMEGLLSEENKGNLKAKKRGIFRERVDILKQIVELHDGEL